MLVKDTPVDASIIQASCYFPHQSDKYPLVEIKRSLSMRIVWEYRD